MDGLKLLYTDNQGNGTYLVLRSMYAETEGEAHFLRAGQLVSIPEDAPIFLVPAPLGVCACA
jgi:hypothetical protein